MSIVAVTGGMGSGKSTHHPLARWKHQGTRLPEIQQLAALF
jgi:hypothetical protein